MPNSPLRSGRTRQKQSRILRAGITGGIGSGKSIVCRMLEEAGMPVLYADAIAKELQESDLSVKQELIRILGDETYLPDGALNRSFVASRIFSDKKIRNAVNRAVHPAVIRECARRIEVLEERGTRIVAVEAALLFESGFYKELDAVIVIAAREDLRIRRIVERDGVSESEVRLRMAAQWPQERKVGMADYVLGNDGTLQELRARVDLLHSILRSLSEKD